MDQDDRNLLRRTHKGHEASARLLWQRHAGWMSSYAGMLIGVSGPVRPEDVVQGVFLHLLELDRATVRGVREVRPWLACLVRRQALNELRTTRRRDKRERARARPPERDPPEHDELRAAMARLSRRHREVLHLRLALGLTIEQTAETLGLPRGTVASRQHAAVAALRSILTVADTTIHPDCGGAVHASA